MGEEAGTIEEVYEPFLIQEGYIVRTPRGREATEKAYKPVSYTHLDVYKRHLWNELKQKKMLGFDFDRQRPILNYIVDFYCKDLMLAIEIDGGSHDDNLEADEKRQLGLENAGVNFLRFDDQFVRNDIENVLYLSLIHI